MGNLILIATIILPLGWLAADIWGSTSTRRSLGVIAIFWSSAVAYSVGSLVEGIKTTAEFSDASKELLEYSVQQMQAGKSDVVQREWARMNEEYEASYESRGRYREVIDGAIQRMKRP